MKRGRPYIVSMAILVRTGEVAESLGISAAEFLDACIQNASMGATATGQTKEVFLTNCAAAFDHSVSLAEQIARPEAEEGEAP